MRIAFLPELKQECAKEKGQRISGKKKKQRKHESILQNYENKETGTRTDIKAQATTQKRSQDRKKEAKKKERKKERKKEGKKKAKNKKDRSKKVKCRKKDVHPGSTVNKKIAFYEWGKGKRKKKTN